MELQAIFHGDVQGVFFRATTCEHAKRLGLVGFVQNMPDGTVKLVAQGERQTLDTLLDFLVSEGGPGLVSSVEKEFLDSNIYFTDFNVKYN